MELKNGDILTIEDRKYKILYDCKIVIEGNYIYICSNLPELKGSEPKNKDSMSPYKYSLHFRHMSQLENMKKSKSHPINGTLRLIQRKKQEGLSLWF